MNALPVSPEEYRKGRTKVVKLSSGYEFVIGKVSKNAMSSFLDIVGVKPKAGMTLKTIEEDMAKTMDESQAKERVFKALDLMVPAGTIEPKIVRESPAPEGTLHIDEIDFGDQLELFLEIIDFQGISAAAEKFRDRIPRPASREPSPSA